MEAELNIPTDTLDRDEIKRLRKIRNKLKRERQKAQKQESTIDLSLNTTKGHVAIVRQDVFDIVNNGQQDISRSNKKKRELVVNITEIKTVQPNKINTKEKSLLDKTVTIANKLDKSQPVLLKGKRSEVNKGKALSTLKKAIIESRSDDKSIERYNYTNNVVTEILEQLSSNFIKELVILQEKYFQKDPKKAGIKRRYVVGFHQANKYIKMKKIHLLFIATDMKLQCNDPLDILIKELIGLAEENSLHYVFVLKRRLLGRITLKQVPVSCLGVLNYDGLNEEYKTILEEIQSCKQKFESIEEPTRTDHDDISSNLLQKIKVELKR